MNANQLAIVNGRCEFAMDTRTASSAMAQRCGAIAVRYCRIAC